MYVFDIFIMFIKLINIFFIKIFLMMKMVEFYMLCIGNKKVDSVNIRKIISFINVIER